MSVRFIDLLTDTVELCGLDPDNLPQPLANNFATWLQQRLKRAWTMTLWPETLLLEPRSYAPAWVAGNYSTGAVVYDAANTKGYYQASTGVTSADVPGTSANWVGYFAPRVIPFTQTPSVISEPINCWKDDPRAVRAPRKVAFWKDSVNVYLDPQAPNLVYLQFRVPAPRFSAKPYDVTKVYQPKERFLWTDGNAYVVLVTTTAGQTPLTTPASFAVQTTPEVLADFAGRAAKADWLSDDGQDDKAAMAESAAQGWLNDRMADLTILQRQTANYRVA